MMVARRITSQDVIEQLYELFLLRGVPEHIRSDNGPEFTAKGMRKWLSRVGVKTLFIEPGSPWENGYVESFNSKLSTGLFKQFCPFRSIELLCGEHGDEILVAKFRGRTVGLNVVFMLFRSLSIHVVGVPCPVRAAGRDRVNSPVSIYPEFGILEPLWRGMSSERLPGRFIGPVHLHPLLLPGQDGGRDYIWGTPPLLKGLPLGSPFSAPC
jgi:hypothetical protein